MPNVTCKQNIKLQFHMKRHFLLTIFTLVFFHQVSCQERTYKAVKYPGNYKAKIDLVYTKTDNWEGRMDVYTNLISEKPPSMVINIHGRGWNHGVKESQAGFGFFLRRD